MKVIIKVLVLNVSFILTLMTSLQAHADEWTSWGRANEFYVSDAYPDIVRVRHAPASPGNPAACIKGDTEWVDIEINKAGRSSQEFEQMINTIYMSIATYRNIRLFIDGTRCSPDGFRLANGVGLNNP